MSRKNRDMSRLARGKARQGKALDPNAALLPDPEGECEGDLGWRAFWDSYPWKAGKQEAVRAWGKLTADERIAAVAAVPRWIRSGDWQKDDGRWIPRPATFLNKHGWEDEPKQATVPAIGVGKTAGNVAAARAFLERGAHGA